MKQLLQIIACSFIVLAQAVPVRAQSTDIVKFYIAYDQSGSIGIHDSSQALQQMAARLLQINLDEKNIKSPVVFELYEFGGDVSKPAGVAYNPFDSDGSDLSTQTFLSKTTGSRTQRYSHIHTALEAIQQKIRADKAGAESAGVFIFTDGLLDSSDVDFSPKKTGKIIEKSLTDQQAKATDPITDLTGYQNYLARLVQSIQLRTKNNLYVVQTSPAYINSIPVLDSLRSSRMPANVDFAANRNLFWLHSREGRIDSAAIRTAFDHFVQEAILSIMSPPAPKSVRDSVEVALMVQEIHGLVRYTGADLVMIEDQEIQSISALDANNITAFRATIASVNELLKLLSTENPSKDKGSINAIKEAIKSLTQPPNSLYLPIVLQILDEKAINKIETERKVVPAKSLSNIYLHKGFSAGAPTSLDPTVRKQMTQNIEQSLILGFTDYVIDRAKQEAVYAFLENLNDRVFADHHCDDYPDNYLCFIKDVLFAHVGELMNERHTFPDMAMLKAAFQQDLQQFPNALMQYYGRDERPISDGIYTLIAFMKLFDQLMDTGDLERSFKDLQGFMEKTPKHADDDKWINIRQGLLFTTQLVGHLHRHDLATLYNDSEALELLSSMLVVFSIDTTLVKEVYMKAAAEKVKKVYHSYRQIKQQIESLQNLMTTTPQADYQGYRVYQKDLFNDVISHIAELLLVGNDILYDISLTQVVEGRDRASYAYRLRIDQLTRSARKSVDAWFMLKEGAYVQAMLFIVPELKKIIPQYDLRMDTRAVEMAHNLMYIAGEVSVAQNSNDVKNIIANYAMPVASYRTKRLHPGSFMLTAYAGVGFNAHVDYGTNWFLPAIIAPAGLEYTLSKDSGKSISFMASIIDIGNVINYRLLGTQTDSDEVVRFERILSPGIHVSYGIWQKLPISINAGYQWNPQRVSIGAFMDMPLVTFWKK